MTTEHPITPPLELVRQWHKDYLHLKVTNVGCHEYIATQAARWGDEQRLEACIDVILAHPGLEHPELLVEVLRAAFRPKPPSLAEQALAALSRLNSGALCANPTVDKDTIRRALEQLDD